MNFPGGSAGEESACNVGDLGLIPRLGRSPGEGNDYPFQYSCLENSMDRGAWRATVHGVLKSRTQLRDWVQCCLTISSSATLFSSCLQSFPVLGSFPVSQLFSSSLSIWASATVLPMNNKGWFPLGSTSLTNIFLSTHDGPGSEDTMTKDIVLMLFSIQT